MLSERQQLTLQRLRDYKKITTPNEIRNWCRLKLTQNSRKRRHSKQYIKEILISLRDKGSGE